MSLTELNLGIITDANPLALKSTRVGEKVVRSDNGLHQHSIQILISDTEIGSVSLEIDGVTIEVPTYKLILTDTKTEEISVYEVTRDILSFSEKKVKKSFWSFLGIKRFNSQHLLYENITFEPGKDLKNVFTLNRYRSLSKDTLLYNFQNKKERIFLYSGDVININGETRPNFMVVDEVKGMRFIGDIAYREKMLKLTPKVQLTLIQRSKVPRKFKYSSSGKLEKRIYL